MCDNNPKCSMTPGIPVWNLKFWNFEFVTLWIQQDKKK